jgi:hypothetical protein
MARARTRGSPPRQTTARARGAILAAMPDQGYRAPTRTARDEADLHVCISCGSTLVQPVKWSRAGSRAWRVLLRCPECDLYREDVVGQQAVYAFDRELDRGFAELIAQHDRLVRANLAEEAKRLAAALAADALLPEDF